MQGVDESWRGENQSVFFQLCEVQEGVEEDDEHEEDEKYGDENGDEDDELEE